jgi:hypothetical protein
MNKHRASFLGLRLGLTLILGWGIPAITIAADTSPVVGNWEGTLDPGAQPKRRLVVHISVAQDGTLGGTVDYPDQDISGIPITAITYKEPTLHFESNQIQVLYDGTMNKAKSEITGSWKQGGPSVSLILKRTP